MFVGKFKFLKKKKVLGDRALNNLRIQKINDGTFFFFLMLYRSLD